MLRDKKGRFIHGHIPISARNPITGKFITTEGEPLPDQIPRFGEYLTIEQQVDKMLSKRKVKE